MNAFAMKLQSEDNSHVNGDISLPQQKKKRQKILITDIVLDYAKNSTLHGLQYVAEKGLTTLEKLFWIVTFTGSVVLCSFLIRNVYVKWKTSPVIVTVSERLVSVGEVPFPSVTICPQIKSKATVYNFSQELDKILKKTNETSKQDINKLSDTSIICGVSMQFRGITERSFTNESIIVNIDEVSPRLDDTFLSCRGHNIKGFNCTKLFKKVYTAEGLCYNMNGLASDEMFHDTVQGQYKYSERDIRTNGWSLRSGYTRMVKQPFPLPGSENIASPELEVYLLSRVDDSDGLCNGMNSGYKIYIQHPTDHPQSSLYYYAALDGEVSSMAISPDVLSSASSIEDYPVETRQCYFQKDRTLRYFKIYTASNCRAECISNYTYKECRCVGFHMPHDNSSEICAERKLDCMEHAQKVLAETELQIRINKSGDGCRCLAACNSIEYNAEIIRTEFHVKRYVEKLMAAHNASFDDFYGKKSKFSKIEFYFKKPQFVSMRRSEMFGLTDFLANIGGLLGMFLGFSFLSLLEMIYFITLRLGCSLKRDLEEEKVRAKAHKIANSDEPMSIIIE